MQFKLPWTKQPWQSKAAYAEVEQEEVPLSDSSAQHDEFHDEELGPTPNAQAQKQRPAWLKWLALIVAILAAFAVFEWAGRFFSIGGVADGATSASDGEAPAEINPPVLEEESGGRVLHFLLPATSGNDQLCRTIFTSVTMGFPEPVLINWGAQPVEGEFTVSHLYKITGIKKYLASLGSAAADDLVIISDAFDVAFNLPPEILIQRYEKIIEQENDRIRQLMGSGALKNGYEAKAVFAADKGCAGHIPNQHWCWLQQESTLPTDMYRNNTDTSRQAYDHWSSTRPRYLNSGIIVGPVSTLLGIMQRTEDFIKIRGRKISWQDSDQEIIIQVYAEQEMTRIREAAAHPEWREEGDPPVQNRTAPNADKESTRNPAMHRKFDQQEYANITMQDDEIQRGYEFGITIDFGSSLSHTTSASDHEWAFLRYDPTEPQARISGDNPGDCKHNVHDDIPDDIASTPMPFADVVANSTEKVGWRDFALYTNMCTGTIPCVIHHNGDKGQREKQWPTLWYSTHGMDILAAARTRLEENPNQSMGAGDVRTDAGERIEWPQLCQEYEHKLFVKDLDDWAPGTTSFGQPPELFNRVVKE